MSVVCIVVILCVVIKAQTVQPSSVIIKVRALREENAALMIGKMEHSVYYILSCMSTAEMSSHMHICTDCATIDDTWKWAWLG